MKACWVWFYLVLASASLILALGAPARAEGDASSCLELPIPNSALPEELRTTAEGAVQTRVALVIGNSAYRHIAALRNPKNDAEAVAYSFQRLGFQTVLLLDATADVIVWCKDHLLSKYPEADIGVLYYAGHGIQIDDSNYLLGVDASQAEGVSGLVDVTELVDEFQRGWKATLVFLDACRDNPYGEDRPQGLSPSTARGAIRIAHSGELNTDPRIQAIGAFIAYSTSPNDIATDGAGNLSPFAAAFAEAVISPGISVQEVMADVSRGVAEETGWTQTPWTRSSLEVALRLAGSLTLAEAEAMSTNWASQSWSALNRGDRPAAILHALKGIPLFVRHGSMEAFIHSAAALDGAYRSQVNVIDAEGISRAVFSPDNTRLLLHRTTNDHISVLELWDTKSSKIIAKLHDYIGSGYFNLPIAPPVFSGNSQVIAAVDSNAGVTLWSSRDGVQILRIDNAISGNNIDRTSYTRIGLNNDGSKLIASGGSQDLSSIWTLAPETESIVINKDIYLYLVSDYIIRNKLEDFSIDSAYGGFVYDYMDFGAGDFPYIYSSGIGDVGDRNTYVFLLDKDSNRITTHFKISADVIAIPKTLYGVIISSDGRHIVVNGYDERRSINIIQVYRERNSESKLSLVNDNYSIGSISADGNYMANLIRGNIKIYSLDNYEEIDIRSIIETERFIYSPSIFSKEGALVAEDELRLGDNVWERVPEIRDLIKLSHDVLSKEQAEELQRDRIRFWTAE